MKLNLDKTIAKISKMLNIPVAEINLEPTDLSYEDCQKRNLHPPKKWNDGKPHTVWSIRFGGMAGRENPLNFQGCDLHEAFLNATKWAKHSVKLAKKAQKRIKMVKDVGSGP